MKKMKRILPILLLGLPYLMANSPSPFAYPSFYEDFSNTAFVKSAVDEGNPGLGFKYETTLTNTGQGYIDLSSVELMTGSNNVHLTYNSADSRSNIYLKPDSSHDLVFTLDIDLSTSGLKLKCYAFQEDDVDPSIIATNFSSINKELSYYDSYSGLAIYTYQFTAEMDYDSAYHYTPLVNITYDSSETKTFEAYIQNEETGSILFESVLNLEIDKIEIDNIVFIKGRKYSRDGFLDGLFQGLIMAGLFVIGGIFALGLMIAGLVIGIIFIVKAARNKNVDN